MELKKKSYSFNYIMLVVYYNIISVGQVNHIILNRFKYLYSKFCAARQCFLCEFNIFYNLYILNFNYFDVHIATVIFFKTNFSLITMTLQLYRHLLLHIHTIYLTAVISYVRSSWVTLNIYIHFFLYDSNKNEIKMVTSDKGTHFNARGTMTCVPHLLQFGIVDTVNGGKTL